MSSLTDFNSALQIVLNRVLYEFREFESSVQLIETLHDVAGEKINELRQVFEVRIGLDDDEAILDSLHTTLADCLKLKLEGTTTLATSSPVVSALISTSHASSNEEKAEARFTLSLPQEDSCQQQQQQQHQQQQQQLPHVGMDNLEKKNSETHTIQTAEQTQQYQQQYQHQKQRPQKQQQKQQHSNQRRQHHQQQDPPAPSTSQQTDTKALNRKGSDYHGTRRTSRDTDTVSSRKEYGSMPLNMTPTSVIEEKIPVSTRWHLQWVNNGAISTLSKGNQSTDTGISGRSTRSTGAANGTGVDVSPFLGGAFRGLGLHTLPFDPPVWNTSNNDRISAPNPFGLPSFDDFLLASLTSLSSSSPPLPPPTTPPSPSPLSPSLITSAKQPFSLPLPLDQAVHTLNQVAFCLRALLISRPSLFPYEIRYAHWRYVGVLTNLTPLPHSASTQSHRILVKVFPSSLPPFYRLIYEALSSITATLDSLTSSAPTPTSPLLTGSSLSSVALEASGSSDPPQVAPPIQPIETKTNQSVMTAPAQLSQLIHEVTELMTITRVPPVLQIVATGLHPTETKHDLPRLIREGDIIDFKLTIKMTNNANEKQHDSQKRVVSKKQKSTTVEFSVSDCHVLHSSSSSLSSSSSSLPFPGVAFSQSEWLRTRSSPYEHRYFLFGERVRQPMLPERSSDTSTLASPLLSPLAVEGETLEYKAISSSSRLLTTLFDRVTTPLITICNAHLIKAFRQRNNNVSEGNSSSITGDVYHTPSHRNYYSHVHGNHLQETGYVLGGVDDDGIVRGIALHGSEVAQVNTHFLPALSSMIQPSFLQSTLLTNITIHFQQVYYHLGSHPAIVLPDLYVVVFRINLSGLIKSIDALPSLPQPSNNNDSNDNNNNATNTTRLLFSFPPRTRHHPLQSRLSNTTLTSTNRISDIQSSHSLTHMSEAQPVGVTTASDAHKPTLSSTLTHVATQSTDSMPAIIMSTSSSNQSSTSAHIEAKQSETNVVIRVGDSNINESDQVPCVCSPLLDNTPLSSLTTTSFPLVCCACKRITPQVVHVFSRLPPDSTLYPIGVLGKPRMGKSAILNHIVHCATQCSSPQGQGDGVSSHEPKGIFQTGTTSSRKGTSPLFLDFALVPLTHSLANQSSPSWLLLMECGGPGLGSRRSSAFEALARLVMMCSCQILHVVDYPLNTETLESIQLSYRYWLERRHQSTRWPLLTTVVNKVDLDVAKEIPINKSADHFMKRMSQCAEYEAYTKAIEAVEMKGLPPCHFVPYCEALPDSSLTNNDSSLPSDKDISCQNVYFARLDELCQNGIARVLERPMLFSSLFSPVQDIHSDPSGHNPHLSPQGYLSYIRSFITSALVTLRDPNISLVKEVLSKIAQGISNDIASFFHGYARSQIRALSGITLSNAGDPTPSADDSLFMSSTSSPLPIPTTRARYSPTACIGEEDRGGIKSDGPSHPEYNPETLTRHLKDRLKWVLDCFDKAMKPYLVYITAQEGLDIVLGARESLRLSLEQALETELDVFVSATVEGMKTLSLLKEQALKRYKMGRKDACLEISQSDSDAAEREGKLNEAELNTNRVIVRTLSGFSDLDGGKGHPEGSGEEAWNSITHRHHQLVASCLEAFDKEVTNLSFVTKRAKDETRSYLIQTFHINLLELRMHFEYWRSVDDAKTEQKTDHVDGQPFVKVVTIQKKQRLFGTKKKVWVAPFTLRTSRTWTIYHRRNGDTFATAPVPVGTQEVQIGSAFPI